MNKRLMQKRNEGGFTLIELLIVIVILGILAAIVVFAVGGITDRGNSSACKSDLKTFQVASEAFYAKGQLGGAAPIYPTAYADMSTAGLMHVLPAGSVDAATGKVYSSGVGYVLTMTGGGATANTFTPSGLAAGVTCA